MFADVTSLKPVSAAATAAVNISFFILTYLPSGLCPIELA